MIGYIAAGRAALGAVPSQTTIVAERFFDEGGGMQLILHAPFGGRINKAWGLALRKRFCRGFNFELQAAATDNGLCISLAEQHSFPLRMSFNSSRCKPCRNCWSKRRWTRPSSSLAGLGPLGAVCNCYGSKRERRSRPDSSPRAPTTFWASVFPQVAACIENIQGDREIPDHPLVREVMKDVLGEAMDLAGLKRCARRDRSRNYPSRRHRYDCALAVRA